MNSKGTTTKTTPLDAFLAGRMRTGLGMLALAAAVLLLAAPAQAAERLWTGNFDSYWESPANWFASIPPFPTDNALLPENAPIKSVILLGPQQCAVLKFEGANPYTLQGAGLTVTGINATGSTTHVTHSLEIDITPSSSGDWSIRQYINIDHSGSLIGSGDLHKTSEGILTLSGNNSGYTGDISVDGSIDGGTLEVGLGDSVGNATNIAVLQHGTLRIVEDENFGGISGAGSVILEADAGIGYNNQNATFSGTISDVGALNKSGTGTLTLSGANTYAGGSEVQEGTLWLANTSGSATGAGGVEVQNATTLKGDGSSSGTTTVLSGGTIAPGTSIGTLTLGAVTFEFGATLEIEIGGLNPGSQHDELLVTNTATLGGTLDLSYDGGFTVSPGDSFVILTADSLSGTFDTVNFPSGLNWSIDYDAVAGTVTVGTCEDDDGDSICNVDDLCPGFDDNVDTDTDGIPDDCDDCSDVNVQNVTQATFHPTIQDAITAANIGDVIELGACTFDEWGFSLSNKDVTIRGQGREQTIIDGGWNGRVFSIDGDDSILEDLTIRRGVAEQQNGGGAVDVLHGSNPVFRRVDFRDCDGAGFTHGAVDSSGGDMAFEDCRFLDNFGATSSSAYGGFANTAFRNCLFAGNSGAVVTLSTTAGDMELVNCTFADNTNNWGVFGSGAPAVTVTNCVFDGSNPSGSVGSGITVSSSLYPGAPAGSIDGTPTFEDAGAGDYRLAAGSLGIDAADYDAYIAAAGSAEDLSGDPRTHDDLGITDTGSGVLTYLDMGAYEFQGFTDTDGDGVGDADDICPGFDDNVDTDLDGVPDGCDEECGDGELDAGEDCDDGNTIDGDGCPATCTLGIPCTTRMDCVLDNDDACGWDDCVAGICADPIPVIYGDVTGSGVDTESNDIVNIFDVQCGLAACGPGMMDNCPNADIIGTECPRGNGTVNVFDVLKILDAIGANAGGGQPTVGFACDCPSNP